MSDGYRPIGSGKKFRGVFDRNTRKILTFSDTQKGTKEGVIEEIDIDDPHADEVMDPEQKEQLMEEIELLDGASAEFSQEEVGERTADTCILRFSSYKLWCGDIPGAFP